jgi:hypothetical protein
VRMVSKAIGTRQSQIYRQNVLTSQTAQQIVVGAREEAALASATPSAAPAVAASSSSGPDVAADHGGTRGAAQGPGGPSGAVGTSSVSKSAGSVSESTATEVPTAAGVPGRYEIEWAAHFGTQTPENRPQGAQTPAQGYYQGGPMGYAQGPTKGKGKAWPSYAAPAAVSGANWGAATYDWQPPAWNQWAHETPWWENFPAVWQDPSTFMSGSYTTAHPSSAWPPQTGQGSDPDPPRATSSSSFGAGKGPGWRPSLTPYSAPKGTKGKGQTPPWVQGWSGPWKGSKGSKK